MSRIALVGALLAGAFVVGEALAEPAATAPSAEHGAFTPNDLKWGEGPPEFPKGVRVAVLEGDPSKAGPYTLRAEFPANYKIMPHKHSNTEHVTVLSGELFVGPGEKFDEAKAQKLGPGSFAFMSSTYTHYAFTRGQKTVVQLHGVGPSEMTYVNPADDPRARSK